MVATRRGSASTEREKGTRMAKISDEIREWVRRALADEHMDLRELDALADRVDRETVELPRDRDGVPIHVGETVYGEDGRAWHVRGVTIGEKSIAHPEHVIRATSDAEQLRDLKPEWLTHERPDSWERIADELDAWCDSSDVDGDACAKPRTLADRIRKLAKREGAR